MKGVIKSHRSTYSVTIDIYELFHIKQKEQCPIFLITELQPMLREEFRKLETAGNPVIDNGHDTAERTVIVSVTIGASLEATQESLHNTLEDIHYNHRPEWCDSCGAKQEADCYCDSVDAYLRR
jgi:hypothetical protein